MQFTILNNATASINWQIADGAVANLRVENSDYWAYRNRITRLTPLLRAKEFTLELAGTSNLDGRPVDLVRIKAVAQPVTVLYFERETGLLVKCTSTFKKDGKNIYETIVYRDYRDVCDGSAETQTLQEAKVGTKEPDLLAFLRGQIATPAQSAQIKALVSQLGDDSFAVRAKATIALCALGAPALPMLRAAMQQEDLEVRQRAAQALRQIDAEGIAVRARAALRLLPRNRHDGAVETLLDYLAVADPGANTRDHGSPDQPGLSRRQAEPRPDKIARRQR